MRANLPLLTVLAAYLALVVPTLDRQGVNWDEQTDLDVADVYAASDWGLAYGSPDDIINTRLPMYSAGLVFRVLPGDRLLIARGLSVLVSLLTILGIFIYGALVFDRAKGLVAAAIVALSPYFLFFGKQALTEGDAWIAAATVWVLVAAARHAARPTVGRLAWLGVALGLALSAKISGLALLPPTLWFAVRATRGTGVRLTTRESRTLWLAVVAFTLWSTLNVVVSASYVSGSGPFAHFSEPFALSRFAVGVVIAHLLGWWVVSLRHVRTGWISQASILLTVAGLTFCLVPPVHTTNPHILGSLGSESLHAGGGIDLAFVKEAALFHFEVIALKSGLLAGLGLWAALAWAVGRQRVNPRLRLPLLLAAFYFAFLVVLPWAQTRYMMPLLPLLAVFAADGLVDLFRRRRPVAVGIATLAAASIAVDVATCYPDLNLSTYPLLGERYLTGRSTIGYRALVHTPSDGIEQCLRWVEGRAEAGETVAIAFGELHIVRAVLGATPFQVVSVLREPDVLARADWVVTAIGYDVAPRQVDNPGSSQVRAYPFYDRAALEREYLPAFAVKRAYDIEVATVWRRASHGARLESGP